MQRKLMWKMATVFGLCLLAMIPLSLVQGVINERQALRDAVVRGFEMRLGLTRLGRVQFLPAGRSSEVKLTSSWPHPGFSGPLLADHRIDGNGFRATWKTSYLANNLQQEYSGCFEANRCDGFNAAAFGVDLVEPANLYQQLERSAKYGLLFVILRSQDNALLMGSILLFAFIAAVMIGTRKVDWYRIGSPVSPA